MKQLLAGLCLLMLAICAVLIGSIIFVRAESLLEALAGLFSNLFGAAVLAIALEIIRRET